MSGNPLLYGEVPQGKPSPLEKLTSEQKEKMDELRKIVDGWNLAAPEAKFVDEMCLFRYLSGLQWDLEVAQKQLKETVDWRAEYKPQDIRLKDLKAVAESGWLYHFGFDKESRPIIYVLMGRDKTDFSEENKQLKFKYFVYIMEKCAKRMPEGVYNITWIVDLKDSSLGMGVVKAMKDMFVNLGNYYTERLARCVVTNVGFTLNLVWSFVKPFLAQETIDKYVLVKGGDKEAFYAVANKDKLPKEFFGDLDYTFNFDALVQDEEQES